MEHFGKTIIVFNYFCRKTESQIFERVLNEVVIQQNFSDGSRKMRYNHNFDKVLIKSSWESVYSIHIIVS